MTVTLQVPRTLRAYCGCDVAEVTLSAATVRGALDALERTHPEVYHGVCDESGSVRRHVNVFVNSSLVPSKQALDSCELRPGDVITIMPAVSGG